MPHVTVNTSSAREPVGDIDRNKGGKIAWTSHTEHAAKQDSTQTSQILISELKYTN